MVLLYKNKGDIQLQQLQGYQVVNSHYESLGESCGNEREECIYFLELVWIHAKESDNKSFPTCKVT